jgi:hypothetical protein
VARPNVPKPRLPADRLRVVRVGGAVFPRPRLFVAQSGEVTVVARRRPWAPGSRVVRRRRFRALVERAPDTTPPGFWSPADVALVFLPPLVIFGLAGYLANVLTGFGAAVAAFVVLMFLSPAGRRGRDQRVETSESAQRLVLTQNTGREIFGKALESADQISETWPSLESLVPAADAEVMLTDALWDLAGVLLKAERLHKILVELSRPEFAQRSPTDDTAREVEAHRKATRAALVELNEEVARRVTSIRRAQEAGLSFIREKEMRRAIHQAEESLRHLRDESGLAYALPPAPDAAADLAEHTRSVLDAYRELNRVRPQLH